MQRQTLDIMLSSRAVCEEAPGKACKLSQDKRGLQDLRVSWKTVGFKHVLQSWSRWDRVKEGGTFCELGKQHRIHLALLTMETW